MESATKDIMSLFNRIAWKLLTAINNTIIGGTEINVDDNADMLNSLLESVEQLLQEKAKKINVTEKKYLEEQT